MALLSKYKKSSYAKNSTILMTGTVISMVLKTITTFWLAKYLGTEVVGEYGIYCATYSILLVAATGRYELSIMLPKDDRDGFLLTILSVMLSVAFSAVSMLLLVIYGLVFSVHLGWILFLPLTIVILGIYYSANYWLNRNKRYKNLALNRVIQGVAFLGFSFLFYWFKPTRQLSLILGYMASQASVMIILIFYVINDYKKMTERFSFVRMQELAKEYINFPKISVASGLVNNLAVRLPIYLLRFFGGLSIAGQYSMMENILAAPITIISEAIRDVFRQKASKDYAEKKECYHTYKTTFKTLALMAIIPFVLIMFGGRPILNLVYSDLKWDMAGRFILIMAPFFYIKFVVSPLTFMTYIANKQSFDMKWQMLFGISSAIAFVSGYYITHSPYGMLLFYGLSMGIMYMINFYYTRKLAMGEYQS